MAYRKDNQTSRSSSSITPVKKYVTEEGVLRKHHKFLRESSNSSSSDSRSARKHKKKGNANEIYGEQMAKKYYSKLYK